MKDNINIIINVAGALFILGFVGWGCYAAGYSNAEIDRAEVRHHTMDGRVVTIVMRDGTRVMIDANEPRDTSKPLMRQSD